jgi:hypothetical protein
MTPEQACWPGSAQLEIGRSIEESKGSMGSAGSILRRPEGCWLRLS